MKKAREWAECLEMGGKDLIQSQENSLLQKLTLDIHCNDYDIKPFLEQVHPSNSSNSQHSKTTERTITHSFGHSLI